MHWYKLLIALLDTIIHSVHFFGVRFRLNIIDTSWNACRRSPWLSSLIRLFDLQTLGTDDGLRMMIKTSFFYIAMTMESFIFCFAGEYLSNKVSTREIVANTRCSWHSHWVTEKLPGSIVSAKDRPDTHVRNWSTVYAPRMTSCPFSIYPSFVCIVEQNGRRCGIRISVVCS